MELRLDQGKSRVFPLGQEGAGGIHDHERPVVPESTIVKVPLVDRDSRAGLHRINHDLTQAHPVILGAVTDANPGVTGPTRGWP